MKAVIMGAGLMGQAIAWSMDKLGYDVLLADNNPDNLFSSFLDEQNFSKLTLIQLTGQHYGFIKNADIVISAMPYHQNLVLARHCVKNKVRYCDLGGSVSVSEQINALGRSFANTTLMTDLGLAPGWVNIITENAVSEQSVPDTVSMMVGGLPKTPNNYLKYNCTWSYDGLINEYRDSCEILVNGMQTIVSGMDGLVSVDTSIGELEAFYTSGGSSHTIDSMQRLGTKNCHYKTLRYKGHCEAIKFLMGECKLSDRSLKKLFMRSCPPAEDIVLVRVDVDGDVDERIIESTTRFSAMQQATAFPAASAADWIASKEMSGVLEYKDICYKHFNDRLEYLFREAKDD
jgi:saccharopine dehydrogenase-like NADP-dependent oxidoreductase